MWQGRRGLRKWWDKEKRVVGAEHEKRAMKAHFSGYGRGERGKDITKE